MAMPRIRAAIVIAGMAAACGSHPEESLRPVVGSAPEAPEFRAYPLSERAGPDLTGVRLRSDFPELDQDRSVAAILEIDRVYDLPELPLAAPTRDGSIDLEMVLAEAGIDLEIVWSDVLPEGELVDDPWPGEQHFREIMDRYRNVPAGEDQWYLHLLVGRKTTPDRELSLVADPELRTGAVVFVDPSPEEAAATLHAIAHEIGHLLNLPHPWDVYGNTRSVMSYPWRWVDWDWSDPAVFRFDAVGRRHILRDPEEFVLPEREEFVTRQGVPFCRRRSWPGFQTYSSRARIL